MGTNYYEALELQPGATEKEIKKQYRKLSKKYHPDLNNGDKTAEDNFKRINEAYEFLMNNGERIMYDEQLKSRQCPTDPTEQNLSVFVQPSKFKFEFHPLAKVATGIGLIFLAVNALSKERPKRKKKKAK